MSNSTSPPTKHRNGVSFIRRKLESIESRECESDNSSTTASEIYVSENGHQHPIVGSGDASQTRKNGVMTSSPSQHPRVTLNCDIRPSEQAKNELRILKDTLPYLGSPEESDNLVEFCKGLPLFGCFELIEKRVCDSHSPSFSYQWAARNDIVARSLHYMSVMGYRSRAFVSLLQTLCRKMIPMVDSSLGKSVANVILNRSSSVLQMSAPDAPVPSLFSSYQELEDTKTIEVSLADCYNRKDVSNNFTSSHCSTSLGNISKKTPYHCFDYDEPFLPESESSRWLGEQEYVIGAVLLTLCGCVSESNDAALASNPSYLMQHYGFYKISSKTVRSAIHRLVSDGEIGFSGEFLSPLSPHTDTTNSAPREIVRHLLLSHPIIHATRQVLGLNFSPEAGRRFADTWCTQVRLTFCSSCVRHQHVTSVSRDNSLSAKSTSSPQSLTTLERLFPGFLGGSNVAKYLFNLAINRTPRLTSVETSFEPKDQPTTLLNFINITSDYDCGSISKPTTSDTMFELSGEHKQYCLWLEGDRGTGNEKINWFNFCLSCPQPGVITSVEQVPNHHGWGKSTHFKLMNIAPHTRLYKSGMRPSFKYGWLHFHSEIPPITGTQRKTYKHRHPTSQWTLVDGVKYELTQNGKEAQLEFEVSIPQSPGISEGHFPKCFYCSLISSTIKGEYGGSPDRCRYCKLQEILLSQTPLTISSLKYGKVYMQPILTPTLHLTFCEPYSYSDLLCHIALWHQQVKIGTCGIRFEERVLCKSVDGRKSHLLIITSIQEKSSKELLQKSYENKFKNSAPPTHGEGFYEGQSVGPFVDFSLGKKVVLISGRVHPSEVTASHAIHGLIQFLLSGDPRATLLRDNFIFFIIPMINPDGVTRGHSRLDQHGFNLNRCYNNPDPETQPTVLALKNVFEHLTQQYCTTTTATVRGSNNNTPVFSKNRFIMYLDFHSHASQMYSFVFGNFLPSYIQSWNMHYAKVIEALSNGLFDFSACRFGKIHMTQKEGASRVLFGVGSGRYPLLIHSYTVELSHYAHLPPSHQSGGSAQISANSLDQTNSDRFLLSQQIGYTGGCAGLTNCAEHFGSICCSNHEDYWTAIREEKYWLDDLISKMGCEGQKVPKSKVRASVGLVDPSTREVHDALQAAEVLSAMVLPGKDGIPPFWPDFSILRQSSEVGRAIILSLLDYCAVGTSALQFGSSDYFPATNSSSKAQKVSLLPANGPSTYVSKAGGLDKLFRAVKRENRSVITGVKETKKMDNTTVPTVRGPERRPMWNVN